MGKATFSAKMLQRCGAPDPRENERLIYRALVRAANAGKPCPTADELSEIIGSHSVSTTVGVIQRLEKKGKVKVDRYQRGRRVTIVATGKTTRACMNTAPHWRDRPHDVPSPAPTILKQRKPDTAAEIFREAQKRGKAPQDFLADLVWIGWQQLDSSEQRERVGG